DGGGGKGERGGGGGGHEGEGGLKQIEPSQCRELVEHQQQSMPSVSRLELLGQSPSDLIEHKPHQRLGAADVGGRYNEVECGGLLAFDKVSDPPVASAHDLGDDRIAVETEEAHGGRE